MKFGIFLLVFAFCLQAFSGPVELRRSKSPDMIPWWSVNGGGNVYSGSGSYRLSSSVGQSIAGRAEGASHIIQAGFWNPGIIFVGIEERIIQQIPRVHSISQNYPNPFHRSTTIRYAIPMPEPVRIEVFNITGQSVKVLVNRDESPGYKLTNWDGRDESGMELGCGVYFYRIMTPQFETTKKMLLLR